MIDARHVVQTDLADQMGDDPETWSREFARRFAIVSTQGCFVNTFAIMQAWFHGLRANVLEVQARRIALLEAHEREHLEDIGKLGQQVSVLQRAFDKHTGPTGPKP